MVREQDRTRDLDKLLHDIEKDAGDTVFWTGLSRFSDAVMAAMARVPRHRFVPDMEKPYAYINRPRPIGYGQTISQPYIVALMSELLALKPADNVLEIGTGSGYQAAVLAELAGSVLSVERIPELASQASTTLQTLGYHTVKVVTDDGFQGWPDEAPYDAVIVTAAPERVPPRLLEQLKPGGTMVIPIGPPHASQMLKRIVKDKDGNVTHRDVLPVSFVPMIERVSEDR